MGGAFVTGSAYAGKADGSLHFTGGASKYNTPNYNTNNKKSTNNTNKAVQEAVESTEDALKQLTDFFDWVAKRMERFAKNTERARDAIEDAVWMSDKLNQNSDAISKIHAEMSVANKAYQTYMNHADWFAKESGLDAGLINQIQNGSFDITKYDDDTKTKINEYQDW